MKIILRVGFIGVLTCAVITHGSIALAQTSSSSNYQLDESSIGTSGLLNSKSSNFGITEATGDLGVGESASNNFQIQSGSKTTHEPTLTFSVNKVDADFSRFSPNYASVATAEFSVSNYTSWGYSVQIYGQPPTNGQHSLTPISNTPSASLPGTEQFGINLVANTDPVSVGENVNNGDFGFGVVSTNYNTPNRYRYVSGETIAYAPKSSGESIYTISYLVNVAGRTPGGKYTSDQMIIVTGTY